MMYFDRIMYIMSLISLHFLILHTKTFQTIMQNKKRKKEELSPCVPISKRQVVPLEQWSPTFLGTRDQLHGRQFFHRLGVG